MSWHLCLIVYDKIITSANTIVSFYRKELLAWFLFCFISSPLQKLAVQFFVTLNYEGAKLKGVCSSSIWKYVHKNGMKENFFLTLNSSLQT